MRAVGLTWSWKVERRWFLWRVTHVMADKSTRYTWHLKEPYKEQTIREEDSLWNS